MRYDPEYFIIDRRVCGVTQVVHLNRTIGSHPSLWLVVKCVHGAHKNAALSPLAGYAGVNVA